MDIPLQPWRVLKVPPPSLSGLRFWTLSLEGQTPPLNEMGAFQNAPLEAVIRSDGAVLLVVVVVVPPWWWW
jgi:hypothetical protein